MNPYKLEGVSLKSGARVYVWACGACDRTCSDEQHAVDCCAPYTCRTCGKDSPRFCFVCAACRRLEDAAKERAAYDRAQKISVSSYDHDMVCMPNGRYFSLEEALAQVDDASGSEWAWGCVEVSPYARAEHIIEQICEDLYEDAYEHFDPEKLQTLLNAYIAEEWGDTRCYVADHERIVILKASPEESEEPDNT